MAHGFCAEESHLDDWWVVFETFAWFESGFDFSDHKKAQFWDGRFFNVGDTQPTHLISLQCNVCLLNDSSIKELVEQIEPRIHLSIRWLSNFNRACNMQGKMVTTW